MKNYKSKFKVMKKAILIASTLLVPSIASAATLSLSPSSQSVNVGDTFTISINLDTQGASIDGVDIRYLNYNPALLQAQQVTPGTLMPSTLANSINASVGRVAFSQVVAGGSQYKGSGGLATITFKAVASGNASVTFNHTALNTTDSNVASNGSDILTAVVNGSYTVNTPSSSGGSSSGGTGSSGSSGGGGSSSGGGGSTTYQPDTAPIFPITIPSGQPISGTLIGPFGPGMSGPQVTILQQLLLRDGVYPEALITGYYGSLTQEAVRKFQAKYGIEQTGIAGPSTRAKLNALYALPAVASGGGGVSPSVGALTETERQALIQQIKAQLVVLIQQLIILLSEQLGQQQ